MHAQSTGTQAPHGDAAAGAEASRATRLPVALCAVGGALLATNNWCFVLIPAALAACLCDAFVARQVRRALVRLVLGAAIGAIVGVAFRISPEWAFREAFEMSPPPGVTDVRLWRHYLGGPGEHLLIIDFAADNAAQDALLRAHPPFEWDEFDQRWPVYVSGWGETFDTLAGPGLTYFARLSWLRAQPLNHPEILNLGSANGGNLVLLRERESNRCVALHIRS